MFVSRRKDLLQLLDSYCLMMNQQRDSRPDFCYTEYDFVYLPMDFMWVILSISVILSSFDIFYLVVIIDNFNVVIWFVLNFYRRSWYEGKVSNLGYAFVNFTTSSAASQFCGVYHNYKWDVNVNRKICEITEARIQVYFDVLIFGVGSLLLWQSYLMMNLIYLIRERKH